MLAAVGVMEVVMYAKTIVASTGSITPYIVAAIFYLVVTLPMAWAVGKFENKLAAIDGGKVPGKSGKSKGTGRKAKRKAAKVEAGAAVEAAVESAGTSQSAESEQAR